MGFLLALKASEKYVYVFWNSHPSSGSENETNLERASSLPSYSSPFQHLNRTQLDLLGRCECKLPHAWLRVGKLEKRGKCPNPPCDVAASITTPVSPKRMARATGGLSRLVTADLQATIPGSWTPSGESNMSNEFVVPPLHLEKLVMCCTENWSTLT